MENQMDRALYPGEIYRHFKGKLYQLVTVAEHSETGEKMVIYQALYGDFRVYAMSFAMFVSEVDNEKEPRAEQTYRFERVARLGEKLGEESKELSGRGEKKGIVKESENEQTGESKDDNVGPGRELMAFLDAKSLEERIACLREMREEITQGDLDSIYVVLDMKAGDGNVKEQLDEVIRRLVVQQHYEGGRLR
ncbi:MAG: DUF1653 domain-containing protein [Lachnospiraceae bacterium]|nr:DUF1653 domain-containing protein [Lachnospiraceae bacterium]MCI9282192.1 DUF1653 domain-containing protein [Lachnospiraceae bacterium]